MMRWLFGTLAAIVAGTTVVRAADVSIVYGPPVAAPFVTWTACYLGLNLGGIAARSELSQNFPGPTSTHTNSEQSVVAGAQVGCDYQFGRFVLGGQGMLDGSGLRG